jgi:ribokinase
MSAAASSVAVLGSVNLDLIMRVDHLPERGETVLADAVRRRLGGKGANQAVAARNAGARTALLGAVGVDHVGTQLIARLSALGVDVDRLRRQPGVESGSAVVVVASTGDNQIIVSPGANAAVGTEYLDSVADVLREADVLVLQGELSADVDRAAIALARATATRVLVNLAPICALGDELLLADPLVVNEVEAGQLLGTTLSDAGDVRAAADALRRLARSTIVTLGAFGAVLVTASATTLVPAPTVVDVEDTTGAGDTFVGALAAGLAQRQSLEQATAHAVDAASRSVSAGGRTRFDLGAAASS